MRKREFYFGGGKRTYLQRTLPIYASPFAFLFNPLTFLIHIKLLTRTVTFKIDFNSSDFREQNNQSILLPVPLFTLTIFHYLILNDFGIKCTRMSSRTYAIWQFRLEMKRKWTVSSWDNGESFVCLAFVVIPF